jgi:hypothetical protein
VLHSLVNRAIELITSTNTGCEHDHKTLDLLRAVADEAVDSPAGNAARQELYDSLHTAQGAGNVRYQYPTLGPAYLNRAEVFQRLHEYLTATMAADQRQP